jgi:hypothetical protein
MRFRLQREGELVELLFQVVEFRVQILFIIWKMTVLIIFLRVQLVLQHHPSVDQVGGGQDVQQRAAVRD